MPAVRSTQRDTAAATVLGRAVALLDAFHGVREAATLSELTRRSGLPKSTAHRLLRELTVQGLVEHTADGFRIGIRLFELGQLAPRQRGLREAAAPFVSDLAEATHETVHLAVMHEGEVLYIDKREGRRGPELPSRVGGRMPPHCTAVGKALLAFSAPETVHELVSAGLVRRTARTTVAPLMLARELDQVRSTGVAYEHEESTVGVRCVACPVIGPGGSAVAALSVSGWSHRLAAARLAPAVRTAALGISRQLGGAAAGTR